MSREIGQAMGTSGPADCETIIRYMFEQPFDFKPGSQYVYSNLRYCILDRVIEKTSGITYEEFVQTQILNLSGISNMQLGKTISSDQIPGEVSYYAAEAIIHQCFQRKGI
jgi:N-acyl-D-amino-acid deacylase